MQRSASLRLDTSTSASNRDNGRRDLTSRCSTTVSGSYLSPCHILFSCCSISEFPTHCGACCLSLLPRASPSPFPALRHPLLSPCPCCHSHKPAAGQWIHPGLAVRLTRGPTSFEARLAIDALTSALLLVWLSSSAAFSGPRSLPGSSGPLKARR